MTDGPYHADVVAVKQELGELNLGTSVIAEYKSALSDILIQARNKKDCDAIQWPTNE